MKEQALKKNRLKKIVAVIVCAFFIIVALSYFVIYKPIMNYIDTHTWATLGTSEEVSADVSEVLVYEQEVLKGDVVFLTATAVTIEDITHEGTVTLSFSPEVINSETGELISTAVVKHGEDLSFRYEYDNGNCVTTSLWVVSHRYQ